MAALAAAKPLGVTLDVVPLGVRRGGDVSVQKLGLPANLKKGQTFEARVFATSDSKRPATIRFFRNDLPADEYVIRYVVRIRSAGSIE